MAETPKEGRRAANLSQEELVPLAKEHCWRSQPADGAISGNVPGALNKDRAWFTRWLASLSEGAETWMGVPWETVKREFDVAPETRLEKLRHPKTEDERFASKIVALADKGDLLIQDRETGGPVIFPGLGLINAAIERKRNPPTLS